MPGVELEAGPETRTLLEPREPESSFSIALLGDFSGRVNRDSVFGRRPIPINRDNFDSVMAALRPALRLDGLALSFTRLADFHPDQLTGHGAAAEICALLHHPEFQALEAAWRAVYFLVRALETDAGIKLHLIDATKVELLPALTAVAPQAEEPWAVFAGNYTFEPTSEDTELLWKVAEIASEADAPFLAAASPRILGCDSLADSPAPCHWRLPLDAEAERAWDSLRRIPEAPYLGLALPRFLIRPPYGAGINPVETLDLVEMPAGAAPHEHYLWANPAFACVFLLARAFAEYGWDLRPGIYREIQDMPAHYYEDNGETRMKPCAEALLDVETAGKILDRGLMPLLSIKNRDAVRLARFQSIRKPAAPLAGRWG
jgi:type VI secretion system protein ImpC